MSSNTDDTNLLAQNNLIYNSFDWKPITFTHVEYPKGKRIVYVAFRFRSVDCAKMFGPAAGLTKWCTHLRKTSWFLFGSFNGSTVVLTICRCHCQTSKQTITKLSSMSSATCLLAECRWLTWNEPLRSTQLAHSWLLTIETDYKMLFLQSIRRSLRPIVGMGELSTNGDRSWFRYTNFIS